MPSDELILDEHNDEPIINTAITWKILESDMQEVFGTQAKIGDKRSAELIADGNGYLSDIILVIFDWTTDKELLPEKAVLKITSCEKLEMAVKNTPGLEVNDIRGKCAAANDNELKFYRNAFTTFKFADALRIPRFYCGRDFGVNGVEAGYVAIQHFDNVVTRHFYHTVQESAVLEIIQQLVIIHTHSYKHLKLMEKMESSISYELFGYEKIGTVMTETSHIYPELKEKLDKLRPQLVHFASWEIYQKKMAEYCSTKMLCHGDVWTGNMLWRKEMSGDYRMMAFIDWQLCHLGNPLEDLTRLLTSSITKENYLQRRDFYLETYYNSFKEAVYGEELPWKSFDEFIKQYEHVFILATTIFGPLYANCTKNLFEKCPEDEKDEGYKCYWDKLTLSLDEAVKYLEKWKC